MKFVPELLRLPLAIATAVLACFPARSATPDYQTTVLSQGPVGYWRLNETAQPPIPRPAANLGSLGNPGTGQYLLGPRRGQPGALAGSTATSTRFFNPNLDVAFGGSKVEVPFSPALNPNGPFSVEFWAKPNTAVKDDYCPVASINSDPAIGLSPDAQPRAGWLFYLTTNALGANEWQFRLGNASTNSDPNYIDGDAIRGGIASPGTWHHIVGTFDGSTGALYVNGKQVASRPIDGYRPNDARPFRIGTTCFDGALGNIGTFAGNRGFDGWLEEVAVYRTALSTNDIAAHYATGQTNGAAYASLVLASNPVGYWRLGEPGNPTAANLGSLGANGDGQYTYPSHPGQDGPQTPDYPGFEPDNRACAFAGTSGSVDLPPLNLNTNTVTVTAWIFTAGIQSNNAAIVFCRSGTTVSGLKFDINDPNGLSYNWNDDTAASNFKSGLAVPVGQWSFVALMVRPDQATLCLQDGKQFVNVVNYATHPEQAFEGDTMIGADSGDPNLTFNGVIDEVAIFNRALSVGEVYSEYASSAGNLKPLIFADLQAPAQTLYIGDALNLSVDAGGTPPLSYQWRKNGNPIPGANSSIYTKPGIDAGDAGNYDVIISNAQGSVPSQQANVSIQPLAQPTVSLDPQGRTIYSGGLLTLSVQASGGGLSYQWQKNGTNLLDATNTTYSVASVNGKDSGSYQAIVSNRVSTAHSGLADVAVIVPTPNSYEDIIVNDGPESWWRLDDLVGSGTLSDGMGRHDGVYKGGVTLGAAGAILGNPNTAASFDGSSGYAEVPFAKALNTTNFTVECWVKAASVVDALSPVASFTQPPGRGYLLQKSVDGQWYYVFGDGTDDAVFLLPGSDAIYDKWTHLAITYDGIDFNCYLNGALDTSANPPVVPNNIAPFRIGYDQPGDFWNDHWNGDIDEVAFYQKALTADQIAAHYAAALYGPKTKPVFVRQPESSSALVDSAFSFAPIVEGSVPIYLQWSKNGTPLPNETNSFLGFPSLTFNDSGTYLLTASNSSGQSVSAPVTLAVLPAPSFANVTNDLVLHLTFDGNFLDSSGRTNHGQAAGSPTFVTGVIGKQAVHVSTTVDTSDPNNPVVNAANYVTLGSPPDLQFGTDVNFSISYWVRFRGSPGDLPFFCNAINAFEHPGITFAPSYQRGGWSWCLGDFNATTFIEVYGEDDSINDGSWHHLVHTFDRSSSGKTYLDGILVDSRSIVPAGDIDTEDDTNIGQDPTGTYPEAGAMDLDDMALWRRVLTPFEVSAIYAVGQQGKSFDTYGPVSLVVTKDSAGIQLTWQAGTLLEANEALGPWSPVVDAQAPYYQVTPGAARKFYRVQL